MIKCAINIHGLNDPSTVIVLGRGHGGTRLISAALQAAGVYMGSRLNNSGDLVPADPLYACAREFGKQVKYLGENRWEFPRCADITPRIYLLLAEYLASLLVREGRGGLRGWKLPETILIYPVLYRLFPKARYIWWVRDPRDAVAKRHWTDDFPAFNMPGRDYPDREASYLYQHLIFSQLPPPERLCAMRFEDYVLNQPTESRRLGGFLGVPVPLVKVFPERAFRRQGEPMPKMLRDVALEIGYQ